MSVSPLCHHSPPLRHVLFAKPTIGEFCATGTQCCDLSLPILPFLKILRKRGRPSRPCRPKPRLSWACGWTAKNSSCPTPSKAPIPMDFGEDAGELNISRARSFRAFGAVQASSRNSRWRSRPARRRRRGGPQPDDEQLKVSLIEFEYSPFKIKDIL